jgi:hypothetical protein
MSDPIRPWPPAPPPGQRVFQGSYKPQPKPSEQAASEPRLVFCKDCKFRRRVVADVSEHGHLSWEYTGECTANPSHVLHPIQGRIAVFAKCAERNAAFNCKLFWRRAKREPSGNAPWWVIALAVTLVVAVVLFVWRGAP